MCCVYYSFPPAATMDAALGFLTAAAAPVSGRSTLRTGAVSSAFAGARVARAASSRAAQLPAAPVDTVKAVVAGVDIPVGSTADDEEGVNRGALETRQDCIAVAIVAHVDHGYVVLRRGIRGLLSELTLLEEGVRMWLRVATLQRGVVSCCSAVVVGCCPFSSGSVSSNASAPVLSQWVGLLLAAPLRRKTTLVDALLGEANVFRENETVQERVMDSNDLERERGITILAKNLAVTYQGTNVQLVDTPGHGDFSAEVERVLNMVDGVLLVVDAVEGPKPQTRFVLKKAIEMGLRVAVVVNKIDRPMSRPEYVVDHTFDLFVDLGASDEQADFKIVYASALKRISGHSPEDLKPGLAAVFDVLLSLPRPLVRPSGPLQLMISNVDYDDFKGRLGLGRITSGTLSKAEGVVVTRPGKEPRRVKVNELFRFDNLGRAPVESATAGDIVMFSGIDQFDIGDTLCSPDAPLPLPPIAVEEPTVRMTFSVNTTQFAGQEGKFVTSRNIRDRLQKELERNVALRVEDQVETPDSFTVCGRGALHLTILIETMRREGYEFMVGPPTVIFKEGADGGKEEPFEFVEIEVPEEYMGSVIDMLARRKGEMVDMAAANSQGLSKVSYNVPTRGLLGVKNALLTATRGTMVMNALFAGYRPFAGDLEAKENGSLLAFESGKVTAYGMEGAQDRGRLLVNPGQEVAKNQIVGVHQRAGDLSINVVKLKQLTNHRSANKGIDKGINGVLDFSLDDSIEYLGQDEIVEVTPLSVRMHKVIQAKRGNRQ